MGTYASKATLKTDFLKPAQVFVSLLGFEIFLVAHWVTLLLRCNWLLLCCRLVTLLMIAVTVVIVITVALRCCGVSMADYEYDCCYYHYCLAPCC